MWLEKQRLQKFPQHSTGKKIEGLAVSVIYGQRKKDFKLLNYLAHNIYLIQHPLIIVSVSNSSIQDSLRSIQGVLTWVKSTFEINFWVERTFETRFYTTDRVTLGLDNIYKALKKFLYGLNILIFTICVPIIGEMVKEEQFYKLISVLNS